MTDPEDIARMSDEEFFVYWRGKARGWHAEAQIRHELTTRLIRAYTDFKRASDRTSRVLIFLTVVLVVLTGVLVWLTARLHGQS
jgi:diacylglycerol kinase